MKSSPSFDKAYQQLNPQQKLAVDTIEGPVMVVAGPGTGKTQILAMRVANILLKTDTNPYAILALTFTESAAKNMRERLIQLIGPTAYSVRVQTFHSFCDEVIRSHPEFFPVKSESQVLTDLERFDLMEELLQNPELSVLRTINSPYHYLKAILKTISDLKREGINEDRFAELVAQEDENFEAEKADLKKTELVKRQKNLAKMAEFSLIYQQYQTQLRERSRYDYDDMIAFVAEAFENQEELLLDFQEKISYFLVDEYQDTNAAQNKVVNLLASFWGDQANIFVVGDPHQSIYRFQGASLENTMSFVSNYPQAKFVTLEIGYRCPQIIYNAAAELIQNEPLQSVKKGVSPVKIFPAISPQAETIHLAEEVKKLIADGVVADEIAILYRNNADVLDIELALERWGIPYRTDSGNDALQSEVVLQFLNLLKVIDDVRSAVESHELYEVMNYSWIGLNSLHVMQIARAAGKSQMSMYERVQAGYVEFCKLPFCENVSAVDFALFEDFINKLGKWGQLDANMTFPEWFQLVMEESGFLNWLLDQPAKVTLLHHVNALFREVKALAIQEHRLNLRDFLQSIATMREHGIQVAVEDFQTSENVVTLSTVHKAKGQEWEYVFLLQCLDGKWGNSRTPSNLPLPAGILQHQELTEKDRDDDDRRLFYVALTRAKKVFTVSYPENVVTGNKSKPAIGSVFLHEISEKNKEIVQDLQTPEILDGNLARLLQATPTRQHSLTEKNWLKSLVGDFKLSITALNVYLRSPEEFLENILLKVPRAKAGYQSFGTAIHAALEYTFAVVQKTGQLPQTDAILMRFETVLKREVLTADDFSVRLKYGRKVLQQYISQYAHEKYQPLFIEKFFGSGMSVTVMDDIALTGRIDRIDSIGESGYNVRVIDYKTGRARSQNEIDGKVGTTDFSERELGLPENIRGPYKRQLLFYKLLTELDKSFTYTVTGGLFDFVEPDRDGKFVQRRFELLDEDVTALKELIRLVMKEIRELQFINHE